MILTFGGLKSLNQPKKCHSALDRGYPPFNQSIPKTYDAQDEISRQNQHEKDANKKLGDYSNTIL